MIHLNNLLVKIKFAFIVLNHIIILKKLYNLILLVIEQYHKNK